MSKTNEVALRNFHDYFRGKTKSLYFAFGWEAVYLYNDACLPNKTIEDRCVQDVPLNLYRIDIEDFNGLSEILIDAVLSVFVAAKDEEEARRIAFIYAMNVAEDRLKISEDDGQIDDFLLEDTERSAAGYEREMCKFLDPRHSTASLLGTSVEKDSGVIYARKMVYE